MRLPKLLATTSVIIIMLCIQMMQATPLQQAPLPASRPLRVRGGGGLSVRTEQGSFRRGVQWVKLIIDFEGATHRAGDGLSPGQGAWLDRGMGQSEPTRLQYSVAESNAQKIVDDLRISGKYYTFDCYDTKKGYLQALSAAPR